MPRQARFHRSDLSPEVVPEPSAADFVGRIELAHGRTLVIYRGSFVVKSPSGRVETHFPLTKRERFAMASFIRPPASPETPILESTFGSGKVPAQEWLREYNDVMEDARESDVVVSDERDENLPTNVFCRIADYIDHLEERVIKRDQTIDELRDRLDDALARDNSDMTADEREKITRGRDG